MASEKYSIPGVDPIAVPELPSAEVQPRIVCLRNDELQEWARRAGQKLASRPGYLIGLAVASGFVTGRLVKRLLSS